MDFLDRVYYEPYLGGKHCAPITLNSGEVINAKDTVRLLKEMLIKKAVELGHLPSREELASDSEMPRLDHYEFCFGTYAKAISACYWEWKFRSGDSKADFGLSEEGIRKAEEYLRRQKELTTMERGDDKMAKHYSNEELLNLLRVKKGQLGGKNPTMEQVRDDPSMPHVNTFINRFGSWSKALDLVAGSYIVPEEEARKLEEQVDAKKAEREAEEMSDEELFKVPEMPPVPETEAPLIVTESDAYHAASPEEREKYWPAKGKKMNRPKPEKVDKPTVVVHPDKDGKVEIKLEIGNIKLSINISQ